MAKHLVAGLDGARLDVAVAIVERVSVVFRAGGQPYTEHEFEPDVPAHEVDLKAWKMWRLWSPRQDWAIGGPIVDRMTPCDIASVLVDYDRRVEWRCGMFLRGERVVMPGPTALVAAMRARVYARFGPEVELP